MGATKFVIAIPPSEGKAEGGDRGTRWNPASGTFAAPLGGWRAEVASALRTANGGNEKLLGVKGAHLVRARAANAALIGSPTLPAWRRYTGVVWDHLDLGSMPAAARDAAVRRIYVPSGLMGIVRADDPVPDYRLKMGARLSPFGAMSAWWCDDLTAALADELAGTVLVDLLPQEHRAAFDWSLIPGAVRVDLVAHDGGRVGGHNAKAAKGLLARHLLSARTNDLAALVSSFTHAEYRALIV